MKLPENPFNPKAVEELKSRLSKEEQKKLKEALNDPNIAKKVLDTPEAQKILASLLGKKK